MMTKLVETKKKIKETIVFGYTNTEDGVVGGYKNVIQEGNGSFTIVTKKRIAGE